MSVSTTAEAMTVSVVVAAYNSARYLDECLDSVNRQSHAALEVIVVDDGSIDNTAAIAESHGALVIRSRRQGPYAARNLAASSARGAWLAFLDADDYWASEKLETQLRRATATGAKLIYSNRWNIGATGPVHPLQSDSQPLLEGRIFEALLTRGNCITTSSVLLSRSVFEELGGFSLAFARAADWHMWLKVADRYAIGLCAEPLVTYRFHDSNISRDLALLREARLGIIRAAFEMPSGRRLTAAVKRRITSATHRQTAWDLCRQGRFFAGFCQYGRSALVWPLQGDAYRGAVKALLRRL